MNEVQKLCSFSLFYCLYPAAIFSQLYHAWGRYGNRTYRLLIFCSFYLYIVVVVVTGGIVEGGGEVSNC